MATSIARGYLPCTCRNIRAFGTSSLQRSNASSTSNSEQSPSTEPKVAGETSSRASTSDVPLYKAVFKTAVRVQREEDLQRQYEINRSDTSSTKPPRRILHEKGFRQTPRRTQFQPRISLRSEQEPHRGKSQDKGGILPQAGRGGRRPLSSNSMPTGRKSFSSCAQRNAEIAIEQVDEGIDLDDEATAETIHPPQAESTHWLESTKPREKFGTIFPGCWIETRRSGQAYDGILLGRSRDDARRLIMLEAGGKVEFTDVLQDDITFVVPNFISTTVAQSLIDLTPSHVRVLPHLKQLRLFEIAVEHGTRNLLEKDLKNLHQRLSQRAGPNKFTVTADSGLRFIGIHNQPPAYCLSFHRLLMNDSLHFIADPVSMRTSGRFLLRPKAALETFSLVRNYVRENSPELKSFVSKAAKLCDYSAKQTPQYDPSLKELVPQQIEFSGQRVGWTKSDQKILNFLRYSLGEERTFQLQPFLAIAPQILKLVDTEIGLLGLRHPEPAKQIGRERIANFLSLVGEVAPWENWVAHAVDDQTLRRWEAPELGQSSLHKFKDSAASSHVTADAHENVRHDFGDLPVYTIDDAGARELDDGISIESVPSRDSAQSKFWAHVHIADPTAVLNPGDPISQLAKKRDHSEYFPERTWAMLPETFTQEQKLSLGSLADEQRAQKTLTFSLLVNEFGEMLDYKIRAGLIRKVFRLTYSAVDRVLGHVKPARDSLVLTHPMPPEKVALVEKSTPRETDDEKLNSSPAAVEDLKRLRDLSSALLRKRVESSALFWSFPSASVSVTPSLQHSFFTKLGPLFYPNQPLVTMTLPAVFNPSIESSLSPAQTLVSEFMVAGNRVAARFSAANSIPIPFRTREAPTADYKSLQDILALRNPATGEVRGQEIVRYGIDFLPGQNSLETGIHWPMGINDEFGYVRATSPLRRYADLLAHWQIKAALLPNFAAKSAPFSRPAMQHEIQGIDAAQKSRGRLGKHAETFWAMYTIKRKLAEYKLGTLDDVTAHLFDNLTATGLRIPIRNNTALEWQQTVLIPELGVRAVMLFPKEGGGLDLGESAHVGIERVEMGSRSRLIVYRK